MHTMAIELYSTRKETARTPRLEMKDLLAGIYYKDATKIIQIEAPV